MTQVFVVSRRDNIAGRFQNIRAYELFHDAARCVQHYAYNACRDLNFEWMDGDNNIHEIVIPNDFYAATSTTLRGTTRRGVDNLIIEAGTRSWEYRIDGLLVTYTIDMMEVK